MIILVSLLVLTAAPRIVVGPSCAITAQSVSFHVEVPLQVNKSDPKEKMNMLIQVVCDRRSGACKGTSLRLEPMHDEKGNVVVTADHLLPMDGPVTLQSVVGGVAVIIWGARQFVLDTVAGNVTTTTTSGLARGVGSCAVPK